MPCLKVVPAFPAGHRVGCSAALERAIEHIGRVATFLHDGIFAQFPALGQACERPGIRPSNRVFRIVIFLSQIHSNFALSSRSGSVLRHFDYAVNLSHTSC
jgi:hypothetical protein